MERRSGASRSGGFTIVEVLMVVAIMTMLFGLVMFAATAMRARAHKEATKAMLQKLRLKLDDYKELTGHYPPDGFDGEVKNKQGTPIRGSACLYEFLTKDFEVTEKVSGQTRVRKHEGLMNFPDSELSQEDPDNAAGAREVLDGWGIPLHYDNTENNVFRAQGEISHMTPVEGHPPDPRTSEDTAVVPHTGIQSPGRYDIWSHGDPKAHENPDVPLSATIATWNVDIDRKETK